jgi:hypothetical protein
VKYSVDTSSLISGFRDRFPYEIVPSFWTRDVPGLVGSGDLRATEEVREELRVQDDELLAFVADLEGFFVAIDEPIQVAVLEVLERFPRLLHAGRSGADPFVIALAMVNDRCSVVCEETRTGPESTVPRIPNVCDELGLRCMRLLELVREEGWTYT